MHEERMVESEGEAIRGEVYSPEEVRQGLRWMIVAWIFGAAFSSIVGAGFAAFLTKILKVGDLAFGLINAAGPAAVMFLFIGSLVNERTGRTKRNFIGFTLPYRLLWLAIAAIPLVYGNFPNAWATGMVGLIMFLGSAAANYGGAGVAVWLGALVPKSSAGSYFARRATVGLWSMILSGFIASKLIDAHSNTASVYTWAFAIAAVLGVLDIVCFSRVPERPRPVEAEKTSMWSILSVPWKNKLFRSFSLYSSITWFTYAMMGTFVWPFCYDGVKENGLGLGVFAAVLFLSLIPMVSMALVTPFWGSAIDRFGPKPVLGIGSLSAAVLPFAWMFIHSGGGTTWVVGPWTLKPDMLWLIPIIQIIGGLTWPAVEQGVFYVQIHAFPETKRSAYIASLQVVLQIASMLGAWAGGVCAFLFATYIRHGSFLGKWFSHYQLVFFVALLIRLVVFVTMYPRLKLEGSAEFGEVAKSVASEAKAAGTKLVRKRGK
jgi:MFS family permease